MLQREVMRWHRAIRNLFCWVATEWSGKGRFARSPNKYLLTLASKESTDVQVSHTQEFNFFSFIDYHFTDMVISRNICCFQMTIVGAKVQHSVLIEVKNACLVEWIIVPSLHVSKRGKYRMWGIVQIFLSLLLFLDRMWIIHNFSTPQILLKLYLCFMLEENRKGKFCTSLRTHISRRAGIGTGSWNLWICQVYPPVSKYLGRSADHRVLTVWPTGLLNQLCCIIVCTSFI